MRKKSYMDFMMEQADGENATIEEAYFDLSKKHFTVWIMLNSMDRKLLSRGLRFLSKKMKIEETYFRRIIHQLIKCGYLEFTNPLSKGVAMKIKITRRAVITEGNSFVR